MTARILLLASRKGWLAAVLLRPRAQPVPTAWQQDLALATATAPVVAADDQVAVMRVSVDSQVVFYRVAGVGSSP